MFGLGVNDAIAISTLASKVYVAYKAAPDDYRHVSEEVMSLQIIIDKAVQYFKDTALSNNDRQLCQKVLKGCQSVLEDLNCLIEKYNGLDSTNIRQVFKRVKLGMEDIAALRTRLISNTILLNSFIQRCDSPAITVECI